MLNSLKSILSKQASPPEPKTEPKGTEELKKRYGRLSGISSSRDVEDTFKHHRKRSTARIRRTTNTARKNNVGMLWNSCSKTRYNNGRRNK